jgi:hypothetical protein
LLLFLLFEVVGVSRVGVGVKAASHQSVGGRFSFANKDVAFQHLDARRAAHDAGKQGRVVNVGVAGKRRVQRQETSHSSDAQF